MNIILIGFMGSGKSAVGHRLAKKLKMDYLDTDELIEKTEKISINEIFAKKNEEHFRNLETEVIKTLQDYDNFVISTGGGMVLREENVKMLKEIGPLVLLWADPEVVYERVKKHTHRPLLNVPDPVADIKKILDKREPVYRKVADLVIDTSKMTLEEEVKKIEEFIHAKNKG
jgi:shikimate kinase